jgi:hypothetical protein
VSRFASVSRFWQLFFVNRVYVREERVLRMQMATPVSIGKTGKAKVSH